MNTARHFTFPYRDLPLSVGAPDTIEATARSSRIARMTVFMMTVLFSWPDGMLWQVTATEFIPISVRVRTHQQSRVESNPVQSDSRRRSRASVAYIQWPPRQCVHTSRVKSSHTSLAESRVVMPHASFSSVRLWWSGGTGRNGCREVSSFNEEPGGNLQRLALWKPEPLLTLMMMFLTTKQQHN